MENTNVALESVAVHTEYPWVKLPHPFLTTYRIHVISDSAPARLALRLHDQPQAGTPPTKHLHNESLSWLDLHSKPEGDVPAESDNSAWARACRSPQTVLRWQEKEMPSLAEVWNLIHAIFLTHPTREYFTLLCDNAEHEVLWNELLATGLAVKHPKPWHLKNKINNFAEAEELLILRSAFWQGAASPFGSRPIWAIGEGTDEHLRLALSQYPVMPEGYQMTMKFPEEAVYTRYPTRRPKPCPGSIVYSRYIPEIDEHFSLEAVNYQEDEHLQLFNSWQNDPRVAKGWNENGTLDQHREYLSKLHHDPHVLCLFGRFNETRFAYFELYWAKEDHYGAHYDTHHYDRGRHSLVGDASFRGAHRVNAWYSSCIHYCFLDDPRTANIVGEPRATGSTILSYENSQGLTIGQYVDLGHKRSVHSVCSREKWFQLCPLFWDGRDKPLESADRAAWNAKL
ncbi:hypothetical protein M409DRAFT_23136 [Zasmidium cellare ATCC 36951]|uniref:Acyltransferase MbtK/IucB-like conserved domain-containing protein n=1 Tax=Zasmidium cellare ATCC 36951 TaxID=1080233 RepID=A0A6A6CL97_ZASCE|nr:uncharacterized protein M409DRAFT_23136 [Zasmidium cellare ATCC 36951]KAF2166499.1 hypothetical protein M409DRAFT_23136 [Zasmidium cellare ATCC 36951]